MGFFAKNPNEVNYAGGRKHWADVIKNTGPADALIWRQPEEDFNTNSTLIVMPGEQALFIKGGKIEAVFDNDTYQLSTRNYPFISRLRNAFTGGISTFNCVVYFVRRADSHELRWGTQTPIQVRDKVWGIRTDVRVRAVYKVRIVNPSIFLEKLIGSNVSFESQNGLDEYFFGEFQGKIKSAISGYLNNLQQELIGIDAYMDKLSAQIEPYIDEIVSDYGLKCVSFSLFSMDVDITKYESIDQTQVDAIRKRKQAQGDRAAIDELGEHWDRFQQYKLMDEVIRNPGTGYNSPITGLGVEIATGRAIGKMANDIFSGPIPGGTTPPPPQPQPPKAEDPDPIGRLSQLKKLLDAGLIEQAEYDQKKQEILARI
ncbi:MAG: SPFH domain-containing protein [Clostridiales bacterium]|nr:SPFH domain-containing protein [Clostridiales bacterium]